MARVRLDIGKVLVLVYEEYKKALNINFVRKPMSYALYQVWKYCDALEKARERHDE